MTGHSARTERLKLVRGRYVLTDPRLTPRTGVIEDGAVLIDGREISAVGSYEELRKQFPLVEEFGSGHHIVLPGLVNAHHHGQGLTTVQFGVLDDYLEPWLADFWSRMKPVPAYLDSLHAATKLIRSGVTSVLHVGYTRDPERFDVEARETLRAYELSGLRVAFGLQVRDRNAFVYEDGRRFLESLPTPLARRVRMVTSEVGGPAASAYLDLTRELAREYTSEKVRIIACASGPQWCSDDLLSAVRGVADELNTTIHIHCSESPFQHEYTARVYGKTAVEHLRELGFLGPDVSLAHAVWLSQGDADICAEWGTALCHNASSNLRLRVGIFPLRDIVRRGVNVALGIDGMGLNDDDDMWQELRLVAKLQGLPRGLEMESCLSSSEILCLATVNGAAIVAPGSEQGLLRPGCVADVIVVNFDRISSPFLTAGVELADALVYRGRASDVDSVFIDGDLVLSEGEFVHIDEEALLAELAEHAEHAVDERTRASMNLMSDLYPHVVAFYKGWGTRKYNASYVVNLLDSV
jgi:5-methylthioadenosine/S-adenosylhomocysteine deaminase